MANLKAKVKLSKDNYTSDYLRLLNGILKLTNTELKVLSEFIDYDNKICASALSRKIVAQRLKMKNVAVLNNYIKSLKDKGCIYKDATGFYRYNNLVSPKEKISSIEFVIVHD